MSTRIILNTIRRWPLVLATLLVWGCDPETEPDPSGGAGGGGTTGTGGETTVVLPSLGQDITLAFRRANFGEIDASGMLSPTAWRTIGFDLDGKSTTAWSDDVCKPNNADPADVRPDGDNGIDNNFGAHIASMLAPSFGFSEPISFSMEQGVSGLLLSLSESGITGDGTVIVKGGIRFGAFPEDQIPTWNGGDAWPIRTDSLHNANIDDPLIKFDDGYLIFGPSGQRRWISGDFGNFLLPFSLYSIPLELHVDHAVWVADISDDGTSATITLGGILDSQELADQLVKFLPTLDPSLCPPNTTLDLVATRTAQASDIGRDGNQDPNATCDGISIGVAFEASLAALGPVVDPPAPPANLCE